MFLYMSVFEKKKKDCCGCNACAEICPKHCIEMKTDSKGFFYPKVNTDICIECGLCNKVCPFTIENQIKRQPFTAYAAWSINRDIHLSSSSGGAAYIFSKYIIEKGGVVYGCSANGLDIKHIRVDKIEDLHKLQGSKYVQSDIRGIFSQVKTDLKNSVSVLFIGTPCQVAGLKNYIKQIPDNLYLVDLICHGVPSLQMFQEHIADIAEGRIIENISFREGNNYVLSLKGNSWNYSTVSYWSDYFLRGFYDGIINRSSCYSCPFATSKRVSDITIGDFWGLRDIEKLPFETKEGVSLLLPSTEKGIQLINLVKEYFNLYERNVDEAVAGNAQLRHPSSHGWGYYVFNTLYPMISFDKSVYCSILDRKFISLIKLSWKKLQYGFRKQ